MARDPAGESKAGASDPAFDRRVFQLNDDGRRYRIGHWYTGDRGLPCAGHRVGTGGLFGFFFLVFTRRRLFAFRLLFKELFEVLFVLGPRVEVFLPECEGLAESLGDREWIGLAHIKQHSGGVADDSLAAMRAGGLDRCARRTLCVGDGVGRQEHRSDAGRRNSGIGHVGRAH